MTSSRRRGRRGGADRGSGREAGERGRASGDLRRHRRRRRGSRGGEGAAGRVGARGRRGDRRRGECPRHGGHGGREEEFDGERGERGKKAEGDQRRSEESANARSTLPPPKSKLAKKKKLDAFFKSEKKRKNDDLRALPGPGSAPARPRTPTRRPARREAQVLAHGARDEGGRSRRFGACQVRLKKRERGSFLFLPFLLSSSGLKNRTSCF